MDFNPKQAGACSALVLVFLNNVLNSAVNYKSFPKNKPEKLTNHIHFSHHRVMLQRSNLFPKLNKRKLNIMKNENKSDKYHTYFLIFFVGSKRTSSAKCTKR